MPIRYATASYQFVGNRLTQPSDQEPGAGVFGSALWYDPTDGTFGSGVNDFGSLKLPSYSLVNLSAGIEWDSGLELVVYVQDLFDTNAKLSLDRERGGRARVGYNIGTPRTIGLTARYKFRQAPPPPPPPPAPPPPPPPPPATQTCADGSVILGGRTRARLRRRRRLRRHRLRNAADQSGMNSDDPSTPSQFQDRAARS